MSSITITRTMACCARSTTAFAASDFDRTDIAFIHDIDVVTHGLEQPRHFTDTIRGAIPALAQRKGEGVIAAFGLGVNDVQVCIDTLAVADVDVILLAGRYTLADQSALAELLPLCERRDVAIIAGGPFNSGILATGAKPRDGVAPISTTRRRRQKSFVAWPRSKLYVRNTACRCRPRRCSFRVRTRWSSTCWSARGPPPSSKPTWLMRAIRIPAAFWSALRERRLIDPGAPIPGERVESV